MVNTDALSGENFVSPGTLIVTRLPGIKLFTFCLNTGEPFVLPPHLELASLLVLLSTKINIFSLPPVCTTQKEILYGLDRSSSPQLSVTCAEVVLILGSLALPANSDSVWPMVKRALPK